MSQETDLCEWLGKAMNYPDPHPPVLSKAVHSILPWAIDYAAGVGLGGAGIGLGVRRGSKRSSMMTATNTGVKLGPVTEERGKQEPQWISGQPKIPEDVCIQSN